MVVKAVTNGANVPSPPELPQAATLLLPSTAGLPEPLVFPPYKLVPPPCCSIRPPTLCSHTFQCHFPQKVSLSVPPSLLGLLSPRDSQDGKTLMALAIHCLWLHLPQGDDEFLESKPKSAGLSQSWRLVGIWMGGGERKETPQGLHEAAPSLEKSPQTHLATVEQKRC